MRCPYGCPSRADEKLDEARHQLMWEKLTLHEKRFQIEELEKQVKSLRHTVGSAYDFCHDKESTCAKILKKEIDK